MIFSLLGVTDWGLVGLCLLSQLGAILLVAVRPVSLSLVADHLVRDWGLRLRQRHRLPGRNHVELARNQDHKSTLLAGAPSDAAGIITGAPIDVGAGRAHNGRAGVLGDHQSAEFGVGTLCRDR